MSMKMTDCPSYNRCSAPLCPLDPNLKVRIWFTDEDICSGSSGSGKRWIKKQRSIVRRKTKSWFDKPINYQELYDASRPKRMSEEQRAELRERLDKAREFKKVA